MDAPQKGRSRPHYRIRHSEEAIRAPFALIRQWSVTPRDHLRAVLGDTVLTGDVLLHAQLGELRIDGLDKDCGRAFAAEWRACWVTCIERRVQRM